MKIPTPLRTAVSLPDRRRAAVALGAFVFALLGSAAANAQSTPGTAAHAWPDRPMRLVVPFSAGGGTDLVAESPADGPTLLSASAAHSFSPTVYAKLPYAQNDFTAITVVNER